MHPIKPSNTRLKGLAQPLPIQYCEHLDKLLAHLQSQPVLLCPPEVLPRLMWKLLQLFEHTQDISTWMPFSSIVFQDLQHDYFLDIQLGHAVPLARQARRYGRLGKSPFLKLNSFAQKYVENSRLLPQHTRLYLTAEVCPSSTNYFNVPATAISNVLGQEAELPGRAALPYMGKLSMRDIGMMARILTTQRRMLPNAR